MAWIFFAIIAMAVIFIGILLWRRRIARKQADFDFRMAMASDIDCIRQEAEAAKEKRANNH